MDFDDITMEHVFFFLLILIGVAIVMWLFYYTVTKSQERENDKQPLQVKKAKVIEKTPNITDIFIVFATEDGIRVRLNTKKYDTLVVGDSGTLTWQGTRLISFELDTASFYQVPNTTQNVEEVSAKTESEPPMQIGHFKECPKCRKKQQSDRKYCMDCGFDFFE